MVRALLVSNHIWLCYVFLSPLRDTYKSEDYAWKTTIPAKGDDLEHTGSWRRTLGSVIVQLGIKVDISVSDTRVTLTMFVFACSGSRGRCGVVAYR